MGIFFGTDGIRGIVGEDLTYSLALKCGNALARLKPNCRILIGRDTRPSGKMLMQSLSLGANLGGANVVDVGVASTPCISYLTSSLGYDFGVVISASHNPVEYNGIKVFDNSGQKLNDKQELWLERLMVHDIVCCYDNIGRHKHLPGLVKKYTDYLCSLSTNLKGLNIAVDCSNGPSKYIAKKVFSQLGANVHYIGMGKGEKINHKCGATYPQKLASFVKNMGLEYGFCFDGDADRIVMVAGNGKIYTGDNILFCLANQKSIFTGKTVVGTAVTNLGLELALKEKGIVLERADVGDKFVIQKMQEKDTNLGGEQSGHIIVSDKLPTGDGLLVALLLCNIIGKNNPQKFMEFYSFPQVQINVKTKDKLRTMGSEELAKAINYATEELAGMGRVLVRPSGTENKIRIMVEAENMQRAEMLAKFIATKIENKGE